jgi:hypothetical protein
MASAAQIIVPGIFLPSEPRETPNKSSNSHWTFFGAMLRNALHTFTVVTPKEQVLAHCIGEIEALALPCSLQPNLPLYV